MQVSAGTNITDAITTVLAFDTEEYDDLAMHSPSVNPSRITITTAAGDGRYYFKGTLFVPARSDYLTIGCVIAKNGANQPPWTREQPGANSAQRTVSTSLIIPMVVGDYCEFNGFQDNTANATVATPAGSSFESVFECFKVSE
jgi:hypothetical protein